jgi:sirohydrochlorin cobaltochelatase
MISWYIGKILKLSLFIVILTAQAGANDLCSNHPGILILAHGSHHQNSHEGHHSLQNIPFAQEPLPLWEQTVLNLVEETKKQIHFPVEVAFGMWDQKSFQAGIDLLAQQGICELRVIPLFVSSHSEVIEVQKYMFHQTTSKSFPINVSPLKIPESIQKVEFKKSLDDHIHLTDILWDRLFESSQNLEHEGFIFVAHGPFGDALELKWQQDLKTHLERLQQRIQNQGQHIGDLSALTLRDDALPPIRKQRTEQLRAKVNELNSQNLKPIIIPVLLAPGGIEDGLIERLQGLNYRFTANMLAPHPKLVEWIIQSAETPSH